MATRRVRRPLARLLVAVCVYGATVELAVHIYCLHHVRMFGLIADVRCPLRVLELCGGVGCTHTNTVEHQIWPRELQGLRIAWKVRQSARATRDRYNLLSLLGQFVIPYLYQRVSAMYQES